MPITKSSICRVCVYFALFSLSLTSSPTWAGATALEQQIIDLVNVERAKVGLSALAYEERLAIAARCHANDMATDNYFTHNSNDGTQPDNSDGTPPDKRIEKAGYVWRAWGENIAAGQTSAQEVMHDWMNSPGHKANILDANFTEIGIGHSYNAQSFYGDYWVQDFGDPGFTPHNPINNYCAPKASNPAYLVPTINLLLN